MEAGYYREQAARARRLSAEITSHPEVSRQLHDMAQDYEELASDIETGAIGVRHRELLSHRQRS